MVGRVGRNALQKFVLAVALIVLTVLLMGEGLWVTWPWQTANAAYLLLGTVWGCLALEKRHNRLTAPD